MVVMLGCDCGPYIDFHPETEYNFDIQITRDYRCADAGKFCAVGQCFKTPASPRYSPCEVAFYLKKKGQPSGWMWCKLYDVTGTCGVNCTPDANGEDNFICGTGGKYISSLTNDYQLITFTFSRCDVCLEPNHCYAVVFVAWSGFGGLNDNNFIEIGIRKAGAAHQGNTVYYEAGAWHSYGTDDAFNIDTIFYICGTDCTPPLPAGSDTPSTTEQAKLEGPRKTILYNLEHLVLHVHSSLGKKTIIPCRMICSVGRVAQPFIIIVKGGLGVPAFFETVVKGGIKRYYEETLHVISKLGIKCEETLSVKEDVRGYLLSQNVMVRNLQETLISFIETLSKEQDKTIKELTSHKKKDKLRELKRHVEDV